MTPAELQEFIEETRGTASSPDLTQFTADELAEIDQQIFECDQCGWWCGTDEEYAGDLDLGTDRLCDECGSEREG